MRRSGMRLRKGDCSSWTARPWRSVSSKTGSPVELTKSASTIVSFPVRAGARCRKNRIVPAPMTNVAMTAAAIHPPRFRLPNLYLHLRVARGNNPEVRFGNEAHALSKAISLTGHCNDVAVLFVVSQGFSERKDVASKVGLLHESVRPDGFHEFVLGDDLVAVAHQHQENLEGFGIERDELATAKESLFFRIDPKGTELEQLFAHWAFDSRHWTNSDWKNRTDSSIVAAFESGPSLFDSTDLFSSP